MFKKSPLEQGLETDTTSVIAESFSNNNSYKNSKSKSLLKMYSVLLLKSILFCLIFFVMTHKHVKNFVSKILKLKKDSFNTIGSIIFFVIYFIVNLFIS